MHSNRDSITRQQCEMQIYFPVCHMTVRDDDSSGYFACKWPRFPPSTFFSSLPLLGPPSIEIQICEATLPVVSIPAGRVDLAVAGGHRQSREWKLKAFPCLLRSLIEWPAHSSGCARNSPPLDVSLPEGIMVATLLLDNYINCIICWNNLINFQYYTTLKNISEILGKTWADRWHCHALS